MQKKYTLYGWQLSYFTGKARSYLAYKQVPFDDRDVGFYTLMMRIKKKVGAVVMPVLRTPDDEWVQDTSDIIDTIEARYPEKPVIPAGPVQRFACYLFEAWADEWWVPIAMHSRWSYPENYALFEKEAGDNLLPGFPKFLKKRAVEGIAGKLRGMLYTVGVRPEQNALMENWTIAMLGLLDSHFARHPYVMGAQPSLADFALMGPMYGHLGRDPWPAREWIDTHPHLRAWIDRMASPDQTILHQPAPVPDTIPDSLTPIFQVIFAEFIPMVQAIAAKVQAASAQQEPGKPLPRSLGDIDIPMGNGIFRRGAMPFTLWKAQRAFDAYQAMTTTEKKAVSTWLASLDGTAVLDLTIPRVKRQNVRVVLESKL